MQDFFLQQYERDNHNFITQTDSIFHAPGTSVNPKARPYLVTCPMAVTTCRREDMMRNRLRGFKEQCVCCWVVWVFKNTGRQTYAKLSLSGVKSDFAVERVFCLELLKRVCTQGVFFYLAPIMINAVCPKSPRLLGNKNVFFQVFPRKRSMLAVKSPKLSVP